jgi:hypothetical protein
MKYELKSIGYWALIKILFLINLIGGFIMGFLFAIFMGLIISLMDYIGPMSGIADFEQEMPPVGFMLIFYPFLFAIGGAIFYTAFGVIVAFIYNMIARLVGGLEINLNEIQLQPVGYPQPSPGQPIYAQASDTRSASPPPPPAYTPPPPPIEPLPPHITPPPEENGDEQQRP